MNEQEFDRLFKQNLKALDHVPDVPWDDESVWVKLEPVLHKGNNHKKYFLIAFLLLLAGLSWWNFPKQQKTFNKPISETKQVTAAPPKVIKQFLKSNPEVNAVKVPVPKQTQAPRNKPLVTEKQPALSVKPIRIVPSKVITTVTKDVVTNPLPQKLTLMKQSGGYLEPRKSPSKLLIGISSNLDFEKAYIRPLNKKGTFGYGIGLKDTFTPPVYSETSLLFRRHFVNLFVNYRYVTPDNNFAFIIRTGVVQPLPFASAQTTTFYRPVWESQGRVLIKLWENKQKTSGTFFFINTPPLRLQVKPFPK